MTKSDTQVNKQSLILSVLEAHPYLSATQAEQCVDAILDEMKMALTCGERVEIRGFGSFSVRAVEEGEVRNPKTGERVRKVRGRRLYFRQSKELLKRLND